MDVDDLRKLHDEVWEKTSGPRPMWVESRKIENEELLAIVRWAKDNDGICEPINACMGFGFGVRLWEPPTQPGLSPDFVLTVTSKHLELKFEEGWRVLSLMTHNDRNEHLLKHFFDIPLQPKSHYEY